MSRLRRSRVLPRLLWLATWVFAPVSRRLAGRAAAGLWFVPWRPTVRRGTRPRSPTHGTPVAGGTPLVADGHLPVLVPGSAGRFATVPLAQWTAGDPGPTVLLVHGWAGRATSLGHVAAALADAGHRVMAVDLPAHGDSPGLGTDGYVAAQVVAQVARKVDAEVVVAHSLGALATLLALRDGIAPRGVLLLAPVVRVEHALEHFATHVRLPHRAHEGLVALLERRFGPGAWEELALDRHVAALAVPGLVVHDRDDRQVLVEDARRLVASWPGATLVETAGLGHHRILRDPEVVATVVAHVARLIEPDDVTAGGVRRDRQSAPRTG